VAAATAHWQQPILQQAAARWLRTAACAAQLQDVPQPPPQAAADGQAARRWHASGPLSAHGAQRARHESLKQLSRREAQGLTPMQQAAGEARAGWQCVAQRAQAAKPASGKEVRCEPLQCARAYLCALQWPEHRRCTPACLHERNCERFAGRAQQAQHTHSLDEQAAAA